VGWQKNEKVKTHDTMSRRYIDTVGAKSIDPLFKGIIKIYRYKIYIKHICK